MAKRTRSNMRQVAKNIVRSLSGVSFPLAGSIVVIYTLSGQTRRVAMIATTIAILGHVLHSTLELNDGGTDREETDNATTNSTSLGD